MSELALRHLMGWQSRRHRPAQAAGVLFPTPDNPP